MSRSRGAPYAHTRVPDQVLNWRCNQLLQTAYAPATARIYRQALTCYRKFAILHALPFQFPQNVQHLSLFIAYLSCLRYAPNTIITYAVSTSQETLLNTGLNLSGHFLIKKLIRSLKRSRQPDIRRPITQPILERLVKSTEHVCSSFYESRLFNSSFTMAFHGLLRVSEFCSTRRDTAGGALKANHVKLVGKPPDSLKVKITHSKTDQLGKSVFMTLHSVDCHRICPVMHALAYLQVRPQFDPKQPFYVHLDGSPLTEGQFNSILRQCIHFLGLQDAEAYSSHSFRIGGATSLAAQGASEEAVRAAGRWRSNTYKAYIRPNLILPWH